MKKLYLLTLSIFCLFSCGSGRIVTTETKPTETIIFGKFTINSKTPLKNKKVLIHFNERLWGKNAVWLDDNGYFYLKIPLGKNFIALVEYREGMGFYKNIPDNYATFDLSQNDKIYYIGDIELEWTPSKQDKRKAGGVVGAISEANKKGEKAGITIRDSKETIDYFKQLFPDNTKEIITQLTDILSLS
ncbi:MAG: hypothetical protein LBG31_02260 [Prevotellaceae bacterium]|jgi:hypothetical protein|nr:hypothetical protein [Prevotellaceae bacterium]